MHKTLILLHGFLGDSQLFSERIKAFEHYERHSLSLPYHHSDSAGSESIQSFCKIIKSYLDERNLKSVTFYGYSMGGRVALTFAALYPHYVDELFVESAHIGFKVQSEKQQSEQQIVDQLKLFEASSTTDFLDQWYKMPLFCKTNDSLSADELKHKSSLNLKDLKQLFINFHVSRQPYCLETIKEQRIPLTYIVGSLDDKYEHISKMIKDAYPIASVNIVDFADHAVHISQNEALTEVLMSNSGGSAT